MAKVVARELHLRNSVVYLPIETVALPARPAVRRSDEPISSRRFAFQSPPPSGTRPLGAQRLPVARREGYVTSGRVAADAPAHGTRLAAVRQRRPPPHRRDALRGHDTRQGN